MDAGGRRLHICSMPSLKIGPAQNKPKSQVTEVQVASTSPTIDIEPLVLNAAFQTSDQGVTLAGIYNTLGATR